MLQLAATRFPDVCWTFCSADSLFVAQVCS
jgi:hypothetical protein